MKIPFFAQSIGQFFSHKTNYVGLVLIFFFTWAFFTSKIPYEIFILGVTNGVGFLTVRDSIYKLFTRS